MDGLKNKYMLRKNHDTGHINHAFDIEPSGQEYCYDAGYSSERSPEEGEQKLFSMGSGDIINEEEEKEQHQEQTRILRLNPGQCYTKEDLMKMFPFINDGKDSVLKPLIYICIFSE